MEQYIPKDALVAEIESLKSAAETMLTGKTDLSYWRAQKFLCERFLSFIDSLEVIDPYEHVIQYPSREAGIKAHAEDYSWNIESELFQQLTPEQQKLWRKEIEQACISGGYCGIELAKDRRYDDTLEVKEVDLDREIEKCLKQYHMLAVGKKDFAPIAKHFFELGMSVSNKAQKGE